MTRRLLLLLLCVLAATRAVGAAPRDGQLISMTRVSKTDALRTYEVTYGSGGLEVRGRLFWPVGPGLAPPPDDKVASPSRSPLPAVIFSHDGVNGISTWTARRAAELASAGYVVFAPSFRGEDGSQGQIEVAAGEVDDVLHAVKMVKALPGVSPKRIAAVGMSHGALVSVLAACRADVFRCVVEAYGVMDIFKWWTWLKAHHMRTDDPLSLRVYGKGPQERPAAFHARNAVEHLAGLKVPLLVLQGTADRIVPPEQARFVEQACQKLGKRCEVHVYEGAMHGFLIYGGSEKSDPPAEVRGQREAWKVMLAFLKRNV